MSSVAWRLGSCRGPLGSCARAVLARMAHGLPGNPPGGVPTVALERALRLAIGEILNAFFVPGTQFDVAEVLLEEMVTSTVQNAWNTPSTWRLTLLEFRRRLMEPRTDGSSRGARLLSFNELDDCLRVLEGQAWVQTSVSESRSRGCDRPEAWSAPVSTALGVFRSLASAEASSYEEHTNPDDNLRVAFRCRACHAGVSLLGALTACTVDSLADTEGTCPKCRTRASLVEESVAPGAHARIRGVIRPLLFVLDDADAALVEFRDALQRASAPPRARVPPEIVQARFRSERRGSTRYVPTFDVYIGPHTRKLKHGTLERAEWSLFGTSPGARDPTNGDLERYRAYVHGSPQLIRALASLDGKRLGCTCSLKNCHGRVIVDLFKTHCMYIVVCVVLLRCARSSIPQMSAFSGDDNYRTGEDEDGEEEVEGGAPGRNRRLETDELGDYHDTAVNPIIAKKERVFVNPLDDLFDAFGGKEAVMAPEAQAHLAERTRLENLLLREEGKVHEHEQFESLLLKTTDAHAIAELTKIFELGSPENNKALVGMFATWRSEFARIPATLGAAQREKIDRACFKRVELVGDAIRKSRNASAMRTWSAYFKPAMDFLADDTEPALFTPRRRLLYFDIFGALFISASLANPFLLIPARNPRLASDAGRRRVPPPAFS